MAKGEGGADGAAPPFVPADAIGMGERNAAGDLEGAGPAARIGERAPAQGRPSGRHPALTRTRRRPFRRA
jgi:hypothetical protein